MEGEEEDQSDEGCYLDVDEAMRSEVDNGNSNHSAKISVLTILRNGHHLSNR